MTLFKRFLALFLFAQPLLFSLLDENNDKQLWLFQSFAFPNKNDKLTFLMEGEERWGDAVTKLFYYHMQYCLKIQLSDVLSIAPGYRKTWAKIQDFALATTANIVLFDIFFVKKDENFTLTNRNRTEYALIENTDNLWLFRWRLELMYTKPCVQPYISDELFFLERNGFAQNRFIVGFKIPITKKNALKLEYMERIVKIQEKWRCHPVFGALFLFRF